MLALLLIAGLLVPQLLIYPKRLAPYRAQTFAQDGYYNYYAADFTPSEVAGYLAQHIEPTEYYLVAYDDADHYDLVYYLAKAGLPIPPQRVPADSDTPVPVTLYYVVSDLACYDDIARTTGVPVEQLRRFPEVARFGYYRVHRSPTPMEYAPP